MDSSRTGPLGPVHVRHGDVDAVLHPLPGCRVSRFVAEHGSFYERPFLERMAELLPDDAVVVDGGAHIGNHTVFLAKVRGARVVAFEPNPAAFAALQATVADNRLADRVTAFELGLSDADVSALLRPAHEQDPGTMSVVDDTGAGVAARLRPLDEVWPELPAELTHDGVAWLKLDVEGHEVPALRGARRLLTDARPLVTTEVHSLQDLDRVGRVLAPMGYHAVAVFNPTPTVLWWPDARSSPPPGLSADTVRYAVRAATPDPLARQGDHEEPGLHK